MIDSSDSNSSPLWLLLILALAFGGGSFFWQDTHRRSMLDQIDRQLLFVAGAVEHFTHDLNTPESATQLCSDVEHLLELSTRHHVMTLYSPAGEMVCSIPPLAETHIISDRQRRAAQASPLLLVKGTDNGNDRLLLYPFANTGGDRYFLSVATPLRTLETQLRNLRFILLLASVTIVAAVAFIDRRLRHKQQAELAQLIHLMDHTAPDRRPAYSQLLAKGSPALRPLIASCQQMMDRLFHGLKQSHQFTTAVTHELRTPLTILRGETEYALRNPRDSSELRKILESHLEEINRLNLLIEDLLLISKTALGEVQLHPSPVCLEQLLDELHHQAQVLAAEKNIVIRLHHAGKNTVFYADELRLRQVFLNLLSNAIRFTPDRGTIDITSAVEEGQLKVSITDTGIGMDSEHLQRIFDPFYRIDKKSEHYDGGTGLGLAIVKWIVTAHQGSVQATSTPGNGSTFTVTLPLK